MFELEIGSNEHEHDVAVTKNMAFSAHSPEAAPTTQAKRKDPYKLLEKNILREDQENYQ